MLQSDYSAFEVRKARIRSWSRNESCDAPFNGFLALGAVLQPFDLHGRTPYTPIDVSRGFRVRAASECVSCDEKATPSPDA